MGAILEAEAEFLDDRMRELLHVGFHATLTPAQLADYEAYAVVADAPAQGSLFEGSNK